MLFVSPSIVLLIETYRGITISGNNNKMAGLICLKKLLFCMWGFSSSFFKDGKSNRLQIRAVKEIM